MPIVVRPVTGTSEDRIPARCRDGVVLVFPFAQTPLDHRAGVRGGARRAVRRCAPGRGRGIEDGWEEEPVRRGRAVRRARVQNPARGGWAVGSGWRIPRRGYPRARRRAAGGTAGSRGGRRAPRWRADDAMSPAHSVLLVSDFFLPNLGGVELHMYSLAQRLIARGHKVTVLTHAYGDRCGVRHMTNGLKVYYVPRVPVYNGATLPDIFGHSDLLRLILLRERGHRRSLASGVCGDGPPGVLPRSNHGIPVCSRTTPCSAFRTPATYT